MKRLLILAVMATLAAVALPIAAGFFLSHPVQSPIGASPADLGARSVSFGSDSGALVSGWLSVAGERSPVVLLLPGVRANRTSMLDRARFLRRAGYSVLLIDLQGTGETKGDAITFGWRESRDVLAAVAFIRQQVPSAPVVVLGASLGGAAALLATPPLRVDGMILEAVYPTIEKATVNRLRLYFGKPGAWAAPLLLAQLRLRLGVSADQLRPIDHAAALRCPTFIISGAADRHTTPEDARALYERIIAPKSWWLVPGAAHVDLHRAARSEYERRVLEFLRRVNG